MLVACTNQQSLPLSSSSLWLVLFTHSIVVVFFFLFFFALFYFVRSPHKITWKTADGPIHTLRTHDSNRPIRKERNKQSTNQKRIDERANQANTSGGRERSRSMCRIQHTTCVFIQLYCVRTSLLGSRLRSLVGKHSVYIVSYSDTDRYSTFVYKKVFRT